MYCVPAGLETWGNMGSRNKAGQARLGPLTTTRIRLRHKANNDYSKITAGGLLASEYGVVPMAALRQSKPCCYTLGRGGGGMLQLQGGRLRQGSLTRCPTVL